MTALELKIAALLRAAGLTVAVAESCSGGLLSKRITDIPGSSGYFLLGAVTYANRAKETVLGLPHELIEKHGAVSSEVATAMATGVRSLAGSDIGIATTGIAGPDGGTPGKPVGTVYIAIALADGCEVRRYCFPGDRAAVRDATAEAALELLSSRIQAAAMP